MEGSKVLFRMALALLKVFIHPSPTYNNIQKQLTRANTPAKAAKNLSHT